jgi:hypothetical protein
VLPPLAATRKYDVVVLGAQSRREGLRSIFGGVASRIFEATEGDVVLVKAPPPGAARAQGATVSDRQQRSHEVEQFV